jgi:hypothetical protein
LCTGNYDILPEIDPDFRKCTGSGMIIKAIKLSLKSYCGMKKSTAHI